MLQFRELCMYCGGESYHDTKHPDKDQPLHAAASRSVSGKYVDEFTNNMRMMAAKLGDTKILNIVSQDVRSAE